MSHTGTLQIMNSSTLFAGREPSSCSLCPADTKKFKAQSRPHDIIVTKTTFLSDVWRLLFPTVLVLNLKKQKIFTLPGDFVPLLSVRAE